MEQKLIWMIIMIFGVMQLGVSFELLCHYSGGITSETKGSRHSQKSKLSSTDHNRGVISDDGRYIRCNKTSEHMVCFAVWIHSSNESTIMQKQSCMIMMDDICQQTICSKSFHNSQSGFEYCCCKGKLCNGNISGAVPVKRRKAVQSIPDLPYYKGYEKKRMESDSEQHPVFTSSHVGLVLGVCVTGIILIFGAGAALMIVRRRQTALKIIGGRPLRLRNTNRNARLPSASNDSCGTASTRLVSQVGGRHRFSQGKLLGDFSRLQLTDLIHRGKYGEVWRSKMPSDPSTGEVVEDAYCVKTFSRGPQQQYFQNERDIYSMTMNCNHPNILSCIGWDIRSGDGLALLVLEYCPDGSLQHYLAKNVIDWQTFLRFSMGAAAGIAHLHSEFGVPGVTTDLSQKVTWSTGDRKCPIVHRDINSRNMVVRRDGTVLISDMGFAVKLAPGGNRYYNRDNEPENAEEFPLQEVGTVRYMAPEVLEGFVNLRECESSLKQVDVYALALVIWELTNRCSALFPSGEPLPYMEPYWHEVGGQPDVGTLTEIVVRQKTRPKFPQDWCLTEMPYRLLKDTLEESWDSDQEARLSAACILERLKSLSTNYQSYGTPGSERINSETVPFLPNVAESHAIKIDELSGPTRETIEI